MKTKYSQHLAVWALLALLLIPPSFMRLQAQRQSPKRKRQRETGDSSMELKIGDMLPISHCSLSMAKILRKFRCGTIEERKRRTRILRFCFYRGLTQEMKAFQQNLVKLEAPTPRFWV